MHSFANLTLSMLPGCPPPNALNASKTGRRPFTGSGGWG